jgi:hypothetical protein
MTVEDYDAKLSLSQGSINNMDIVIDHPDGTRQSYVYETNATGRITTVFSGAADPANSTNVTDGIKSVSTYNAVGLLLTCGRRPRWAFPGCCCLLDVARSMFSVLVPSDSPVVLWSGGPSQILYRTTQIPCFA